MTKQEKRAKPFVLERLQDRVPCLALRILQYSGHDSIVPLRIVSKSTLKMLRNDAVC